MIPAPAPSDRPRRAIVVLGMHRSGTSLLASLLQALGVDLGPDLLLDRVPDNEAGYWEHRGIAEAHEEILALLGRTWYRPEGLAPLPDGWWRLPELRPFRRRLADIVTAETVASVGPWGFKDPRTVRLLPLWREIFADTGIEPTYVLAIRNPEAVAKSLAKRDGMTPAAAQLLWLEHTLDAFRHAGDRIAAIVDYDAWFADPVPVARQTMARLGLAWPADAAALEAVLARIVRPDLRHGSGTLPARLMPEVRELYDLLRAAAPDVPAAAAVAPLVARMDGARRLLGAWGEHLAQHPRHLAEVAGLRQEIEQERAGRAADRAAAAAAAEGERRRADAHARDHAELQALYAALDGRRIGAEAEIAALHQRIAALDAAHAAAVAEQGRLAWDLDATQRVLDQVMPDPAAALDQIWNSTSLRLARPLQRLLGGRAAVERPPTPTAEDQARLAVALQQGFFWNLTGPLRAAARLVRGRRTR
ncbi:sulfotransferase family protein [Allostella vacuolata]|nr:sulfotransferase family protein [Stella vacuolata]